MSKKIELEESIVVRLIHDSMTKSNGNIFDDKANGNIFDDKDIDSIVKNKQLMNLLAISKIKNNVDFLSLSIFNDKIVWTKALIKNAEMKKEIKKILLSIPDYKNKNSNTTQLNTLPLLISYLLNFHKSDMEKRNKTVLSKMFITEDIFEIGDSLSEILLNSDFTEINVYKQGFNKIDERRQEVPLFFNLLHFFRNDLERISSLNIIDWNKTDINGNTIFHNMLHYEKSLYPFMLSMLELTNNANTKNKDNEIPLECFLKYSKDTMDKSIWALKIAEILKQNIINWTDKENILKELIKKISSAYINQGRNNVQCISQELLIEIIEAIVRIPECKSNKIQGFLRGLFYEGKNNQQKYSEIELEYMKTVKIIFQRSNLENILPTTNKGVVNKLKI